MRQAPPLTPALVALNSSAMYVGQALGATSGGAVVAQAAARHMIERGGGGSLVSMASLAAVMGAARSEHYSATKGALMAMTRSMAVGLARHQIRANTIVPGWIDTPMTEAALHGEAFKGKVLPRVQDVLSARAWNAARAGTDWGLYQALRNLRVDLDGSEA